MGSGDPIKARQRLRTGSSLRRVLPSKVCSYGGDAVTRANYYQVMHSIGAMTPNEIRIRENLSPVEGGDVLYAPTGREPIGSAR